jgi:hypothetical protein
MSAKNDEDIVEELRQSPDPAIKRFAEELAAAAPRRGARRDQPAGAPGPNRTKPVAVRFDELTLQRLRDLAVRRNTGYQTLLKQFVVERLYEEEKRERIIE